MLIYLGKTWGRGTPRFIVDQVVQYTKKMTVIPALVAAQQTAFLCCGRR